MDGESPGGSAAADAAVAHDTRRGGAEQGTGNGDGGGGSASGVFHCGSAFATVVSVAGPWPPVAVPVPFRLQPSSDVERLRCEASPLVHLRVVEFRPSWSPRQRGAGALLAAARERRGAPALRGAS